MGAWRDFQVWTSMLLQHFVFMHQVCSRANSRCDARCAHQRNDIQYISNTSSIAISAVACVQRRAQHDRLCLCFVVVFDCKSHSLLRSRQRRHPPKVCGVRTSLCIACATSSDAGRLGRAGRANSARALRRLDARVARPPTRPARAALHTQLARNRRRRLVSVPCATRRRAPDAARRRADVPLCAAPARCCAVVRFVLLRLWRLILFNTRQDNGF